MTLRAPDETVDEILVSAAPSPPVTHAHPRPTISAALGGRRQRRRPRSVPPALGVETPMTSVRDPAQMIHTIRLTTIVRIKEPTIIAFHGVNTRTRRSLLRKSSTFGDVSLASC